MVGHLGGRKLRGIDGDLINGAGEIVAAVAAPRRVTADAPVTVVVLCCRLRVGANDGAVDVQLHSVRALGGHQKVPGAVVVAGRRGDQVLLARPGAEDQLTVVDHVHMPVVAAARPTRRAAETDDLSATRRGGLEPHLLAVHRGCRAASRRGDQTIDAIQGDSSVRGSGNGTRYPQRDAAGVVAVRAIGRDVVRHGAGRFTKTPVRIRCRVEYG